MDLAGARGILVNITAGLDINIEEFETVGNAVKAFASENASVVVGAVIDPELSDELRVTVVATGIGAERKPDITLVPKVSREEKPQAVEPVQVAQPVEEKPAKIAVNGDTNVEKGDLDYLDIPSRIVSTGDELRGACAPEGRRIIFPGVGHATAAMESL